MGIKTFARRDRENRHFNVASSEVCLRKSVSAKPLQGAKLVPFVTYSTYKSSRYDLGYRAGLSRVYIIRKSLYELKRSGSILAD